MDKEMVHCKGDIDDPWINRNDLVAALRNMPIETGRMSRDWDMGQEWALRNLADRLEKLEYIDDED